MKRTTIILMLMLPLLLEAAPVRFQRGSKFGYRDERGRTVIPAKYEVAMEFSEGLAYVSTKANPNQPGWQHGFINEQGRMVIPLNGGQFRPERPYKPEAEDAVVVRDGFVELPTFDRDGKPTMARPYVVANIAQLKEAVKGDDPKRPVQLTVRAGIFLERVMKGRDALLGVLTHSLTQESPSGIFAYDTVSHKPLTRSEPGEVNNWFGGFGAIRYAGPTFKVYHAEGGERFYADMHVYRLQDSIIYIARRINKPYRRYSSAGERLDTADYPTLDSALRADTAALEEINLEAWVRNARSAGDLISLRAPNFESVNEIAKYYLLADTAIDSLHLPHFRPLKPRLVAENADTVPGSINATLGPQSYDMKRDNMANLRIHNNSIYIFNRRNRLCPTEEFAFESLTEGLTVEGNRFTTRATQTAIAYGLMPDTFLIRITHIRSRQSFTLRLVPLFRNTVDTRGESGAIIIAKTSADESDSLAIVLNCITRTATVARLPLTINGRGLDGRDGEAGSDGPAGTPKYTYKDENGSTRTIAGTCGSAGGNGGNGEAGQTGAELLVITRGGIQDMVSVDTRGGRGGRGGRAGLGGLHGEGGPCSGRAANGIEGVDGQDGQDGHNIIMTVK